MFGANIWLTSALTVTAILSASAGYKAYSDLQEAKIIQEHYKIVTDIKTIIAKQYNKSPQEITRDEIIAHLPTSGNWDKTLLLNRESNSTIANKEFVNSDGQIVIDENDKLKLLALKSKLRDTFDTSNISASDGKYTFDVGFNKSIKQKDKAIEQSIQKAIFYMSQKAVYVPDATTVTIDSTFLSDAINNFAPLEDIYQDMGTYANDDELRVKKKAFFQSLLEERLKENRNTTEARLYVLLKDLL